MAKKRTGLQSEIAGIFSGVPVPKKGGTRSKSDSPEQKPVDPASKQSGSVIPKQVTPQPQVPVAPVPKKIEEPLPAAPKPKVVEVKAPKRIAKYTPKKTKRRKDKLLAPKSGVSSSRQKAGIILFIFLSTILVIVLLRPYLLSPEKRTTSPSGGKQDNSSSIMANIEIDWPVPAVYSAADLRDPMVLGQKPPPIIESSEDVVVRGIVVSEDRKYAVIGTDTVQEGDLVPGTNIKVIKINPNSVEFEEDGKTWTQKGEGEKR